ncbi:glycosyl transferase family 1 [Donghicola tyrosinivorans]|uniref:Glycosyl transferase family 1 n=1 Tax=Donghicola tyrosinivorans TaxID=1652492 RepID=A0A2T0WWD8_9RHOB|nr:glycosyl transferase family 1 [Donghicola tyrosinivorans]
MTKKTTFLGHDIPRPHYIPLTAWLRHGPFAMWLVSAARPKQIVELGSHYGYSYFAFCQAVKESGLHSTCVAVDKWQGDEHAGNCGEEVYEAVRAENASYEGFSTLRRKTFAEALADVEDGSVDLLHVDGRHFYDDVKEDFESWIPKLAENAIVLFHDTMVRERGFGVWRYWEELEQTWPSFNFTYQHGLGMLFKGQALSPEMETFQRMTEDTAGRDALLALFGAEGEALSIDHTAAVLAERGAEGLTPLADFITVLKSGELASESQIRKLDTGGMALAETLLQTAHARAQVAAAQADLVTAQREEIQLLSEKLAKARNKPSMIWKDRTSWLVLKALASSKLLPLSPRTRNRFARSAAKRDPNRGLQKGLIEKLAETAPRDQVVAFDGRQTRRADLSNVLVVTHEASRTGAPILAYNIARELNNRYNVTVLSIRGGDLIDAFRDVATEMIVTGPHPARNKTVMKWLRKTLSGKPIEFAVVNSLASSPILPILSQMDIPTVSLIHEFASSFPAPEGPFHDVMKHSDSVVFSSPLTLEDAGSSAAIEASPKIRILPQGKCLVPADGRMSNDEAAERERKSLAAKLRPAGSEHAFVVIGAGRVQHRKGTDLFIEVARYALAKAQAAGRKLRFVWIGDGFDDTNDPAFFLALKDQLKRSGMEDDVLFLPPTSEIDHAYLLADMLMLPSRLDPLPNVAIDAMMAGLPVLCFERATGIARTLIEAGVAETCVADYIDTAAMADKLLALAEDVKLYDRVSAALRDRAPAMFNMATYVAELEAQALTARARREARKADAAIIAAEERFEEGYVRFPVVAPESRASAAKDYLERLSRASTPRRPEPGFNPHLFRMHQRAEGQPETADPYADFLRRGRPDGPWALQVISSSGEAALTEAARGLRTALQIHAYYIDLLPRIRAHLDANQLHPDLFVSTTEEEDAAEARRLLDGYGAKVEVRVLPNVGRDIGPLLTGFGPELVRDYDVIGHVHTKKSLFLGKSDVIEAWVSFLYENILGGAQGGPMIDRVLNAMAEAPDIGIVFPGDPNLISWSRNRDQGERLAKRLGVQDLPDIIDFPIGTMFWMRADALRPIVDLRLRPEDYPAEPIADDGTLLHALERMLGVVPVQRGYRAAVTHVAGLTR